MQRRHLLQAGAALAAGLPFSARLMGARAATPGTPRFLMVFLRGGYDANSLLVPLDSSFYREVRPNIAIPLAAEGVKGATALDSDWALHPALETSVLPLVRQGQACFVPFAGTDDTSRSHFETQDGIELGRGATVAAGAARDFDSGFLNRLAAVLQGPGGEAGRETIAFTDQLPLVLRGQVSVANLSLKNEPRPADERLRQAVSTMYREHPLGPRVAEAYAVRDQAAREVAMATPMAGEMVAANRNAINAKGFELEARRIARLMRERYTLGFVDVGGWDTHVGQGAATGYLASRLEELGRGLAAYAEELGEASWRNTVVVVLSEFGRTMRENGNRGTDHGHGSVHWVLGGGLATAGVAGEQQRIEAGTLFQNRDMPVLNEYRGLLGGLFARQFGLNAAQLQKVFPGAPVRDLRLV